MYPYLPASLSLALSLCVSLAIAATEGRDWIAHYDGPDHDHDGAEAFFVAADAVYVTGESRFSSTNSELFVARFDHDGTLAWSAQYDGPGSGVHRGLDLTVTPAGDLVVVGQSGADWPDGDLDMLVIQYDADGNQQWVRLYDGPFDGLDCGTGVAVDDAGNVFATGYSTYGDDPQYGPQIEYVTISYDPAGRQRWLDTYRGPASPVNIDRAYDIAVDSAGDPIVTGSDYTLGRSWNFGTVKYRGSDGARLWDRQYDFGLQNVIDEAYTVAIGPADEVAVAGLSYHDPFDGLAGDALTIVYESDGTERWTARYNGPEDESDLVKDIAFDATGRLAVCGSTDADYLTILYDTDGQAQWIREWEGGPYQGGDDAYGLALAADGRIYVTGEASWSSPAKDVITLAYDERGRLLWQARHHTLQRTNDFPAGIGVDDAGGVYVAATSKYAHRRGSWNATVTRYHTDSVSLAAPPPAPVE